MEENKDNEQEWGLPSIGITPEILFNPLLSNNEKVLYGFIRNLSAQPRGCFATNAYLGRLVGMAKHSISRAISRLKAAKYIIVEEKETNGYKQRIIWVDNNSNNYYKKLINIVHSKNKKGVDWAIDEEVLIIAEKLSGLTSVSRGVNTDVNGGTHDEQGGLTPESTNEEDSKEENKGDNKVSSKEETDTSLPTSKDVLGSKDLKTEGMSLDTINNNKKQKLNRKELRDSFSQSSPKNVQAIVALWNGLGFPNHREGTKTYKSISLSIRKLLNGTFFNDTCLKKYHDHKFTEQEINKVIQDLALAAFNLDYQPEPGSYKDYLKKVPFLSFLYNPRSKEEKSLFIKHYEEGSKLAKVSARLRKDAYPELTKMLKKIYIEKVLGGVEPVDWGNLHENRFILGSQFLKDFFAKNSRKINQMYTRRGNLDLAELLIESIISDVGENNTTRISPSWLSTAETFNRRLPGYLNAQNILT